MSRPPTGIKPTQADIGRAVVYRTAPLYEPEQGIITSMNDKYVFVRYGLGSTSQATDPRDLEWVAGGDRPMEAPTLGDHSVGDDEHW